MAASGAFRVAQISDTHLSGDKPFFVDNFRRAAEAIAAAAPDLVINTGDISLDGAERDEDLAAARAQIALFLHEPLFDRDASERMSISTAARRAAA